VGKRLPLLHKVVLPLYRVSRKDTHLSRNAGLQIYIEVKDEGSLILGKSCSLGSFEIEGESTGQ
jgi:hypothetical protein